MLPSVAPVSMAWLGARHEVVERQVAPLVVARIAAHRDARELRVAHQVVGVRRYSPELIIPNRL